MKISTMSYSIMKKGYTPKDVCRISREFNLEGIDWVTTYGVSANDLRKMMDVFGLKTVCYTFYVDLNFPEKKERQLGLEKLRKELETAVILGADKVMLPIRSKEGFTREESRKNVIQGLKDAVKIGKEYKVTITIEDFPNKNSPFIVSADIKEAIKEAPGLRVTFDNGNTLTGGEDPVEGFLNLKDFVIHAHFKDWTINSEGKGLLGADGRFYQGALVGEGIVDHKKVIQAMNSAGYNGYINLEYEGTAYSPEEAMAKGIRYLDSLMEGQNKRCP